MKWLDPLPYNNKLEESFEKHKEGTGDWLFEKEIFRQWESSSPSVLWIHGIPGTGKTILAYVIAENIDMKHLPDKITTDRSSIIERLTNTHRGSDHGLAHHYCQYNRESTRDPQTIPRTLASQLLSEVPDTLVAMNDDLVIQLYSKKSKGQGPPTSMKHLVTLIAGISQFYHTTTIVIDGLDECHLELRQPLLKFVSSIQLLETTRILVLGRPETDIEDEPQSFPTVSLEKEEINLRKDMQVFIEEEFEDKKNGAPTSKNYVMRLSKL